VAGDDLSQFGFAAAHDDERRIAAASERRLCSAASARDVVFD
jgi:hypothetical protein